jgi:hypothetical protein
MSATRVPVEMTEALGTDLTIFRLFRNTHARCMSLKSTLTISRSKTLYAVNFVFSLIQSKALWMCEDD